mmetsp:Transcript_5452/g.13024  ORF Transcript_5452/g.13024 Transcript_5452/m.13024 type:complete len:355 (+) Transcript_5452:54-1118(+)
MATANPTFVGALLGANILSLCGCCWYVRTFSRLKPASRKRLFPLQLVSLAVADMGLHLCGVVYSIFEAGDQTFEAGIRDGFCNPYDVVFRTFRFISVLQEMHIASTTLLQAWHHQRALPCCVQMIPLVWILGGALGAVDGVLVKWEYDRQTHCKPQHIDSISVAAIGSCATLCAVAYVVTMVQAARRAPMSVQRRFLRRASVFCLNFLATYTLMLACYTNMTWMENDMLWTIAQVLEYLNGFFNTLTYALQARSGSQRTSANPRDRVASFNAMFASRDSVVSVSAVGAEARQQSDQEAALLWARRLVERSQDGARAISDVRPGASVGAMPSQSVELLQGSEQYSEAPPGRGPVD